MVIDGELVVGEQCFAKEQGLLLPRGWSGRLGVAEGAGSLIALVALPSS